MILVSQRGFPFVRYIVGSEFMRVSAYGTQPDFFIGWFAGSSNHGLIFTNDSNKAAMMHEEFAFETVELLKRTYKNEGQFSIFGTFYHVQSDRTCTCQVLPDGQLVNIQKF